MSLSDNLQRLRKEKGLSQEDVAQKLFVSRQSVSKWENGNAEPGVENLKALAGLYGVTLDELVGNVTAEGGLSADFGPDSAYTVDQRQAEERQQDTNYCQLFIFRLIMAMMLFMVDRSRGLFNIPVDPIVLAVGIWVTEPPVRVIAICLYSFNIIACILAFFNGNVAAALINLIMFVICIYILTRPSIKARFHRT